MSPLTKKSGERAVEIIAAFERYLILGLDDQKLKDSLILDFMREVVSVPREKRGGAKK